VTRREERKSLSETHPRVKSCFFFLLSVIDVMCVSAFFHFFFLNEKRVLVLEELGKRIIRRKVQLVTVFLHKRKERARKNKHKTARIHYSQRRRRRTREKEGIVCF
jgi:hypothetical protein